MTKQVYYFNSLITLSNNTLYEIYYLISTFYILRISFSLYPYKEIISVEKEQKESELKERFSI